ncbi:hypothetical protein VTK73DRAFT_3924 [Phialemonium thermophilum]|uniref:Ubiquinone biosynthesis protein n=1 Tax=Phialemonium thermophilum TaxID=223376 RepID=A0ABR3WW05_9PEZI
MSYPAPARIPSLRIVCLTISPCTRTKPVAAGSAPANSPARCISCLVRSSCRPPSPRRHVLATSAACWNGRNQPPTRSPRVYHSYHSHDHPASARPFTSAERILLSAAYRYVPVHGFSAEALAHGARDAGYLDISPSVLPDGVFGLVRWHLVSQREALGSRAGELFQGADATHFRSVRDKVEALTWERLMGNREVIGRWQEALAIMAQPSYVAPSLKELALLADEIWYLAGDISVDPSWYTKRASLSAIYTATELFMTNDRSADFQETRGFLRRRLDEASELGSAVRSIGQWLGFTASASISVLRSKGMPI